MTLGFYRMMYFLPYPYPVLRKRTTTPRHELVIEGWNTKRVKPETYRVELIDGEEYVYPLSAK